MKRTLIRYKTKPDRTDENEALIKAVFAELHAKSPQGTALYVAEAWPTAASSISSRTKPISSPAAVLRSLPAFQAFQSGIRERCIEPPQSAR